MLISGCLVKLGLDQFRVAARSAKLFKTSKKLFKDTITIIKYIKIGFKTSLKLF